MAADLWSRFSGIIEVLGGESGRESYPQMALIYAHDKAGALLACSPLRNSGGAVEELHASRVPTKLGAHVDPIVPVHFSGLPRFG